jgi:hypothetical protein
MDEIDAQVSKLVKWLNKGLFDSTVVIGTNKVLKTFHRKLVGKLAFEPYSVECLDLTAPKHLFNTVDNQKKANLIVVWGLEQYLPFENRTFALRTKLDIGKHQNLKSVIFCEENCYTAHFKNHDAPFYLFCLCTHLS